MIAQIFFKLFTVDIYTVLIKDPLHKFNKLYLLRAHRIFPAPDKFDIFEDMRVTVLHHRRL